MPPESTEARSEVRFYSPQLMLELGHALVEQGLLTRPQIDELNSRGALTGKNLHTIILEEGLIDEKHVLTALGDLSGIPFKHMADMTITDEAVHKVPARVALRYSVMPVQIEGSTITLAVGEVPGQTTVDGLRMLLNTAIEWILCTSTDITRSIKHFYGLGADTIDHIVDVPEEKVEIEGTDVSIEAADPGVVKFVNQVISEAINMDATDIHIEPFETKLRLRYRVDGILQEIPIPKGVAQLRRAISSCVKIMADMDIAERRKPHDGRIKVRSGKDEFDLRVSVLPTRYGETVNMRILNRKAMFIDLAHLGMGEAQMPALEYLSSLPHGVVLLTGPTGSGKTTTLYAVLSRVNNAGVKIITVEDPIEYQMQGISQIQVHARIGLTFANILRSILRHDPDIVLIGEIRDSETADIAVRASLTGHLVFSTLHTNDAPSAVTRLIDMNIEPFLVSSCLEGVIAQRLVRRICPACKTEDQPDDIIVQEIAALLPERSVGATYYKGKGCPECNFTGYRGRIAIVETMILNDILRGLVVHQRPSNEIKAKAIEHGMVTLRTDGWGRVLDGITTVDEVLRVARKADSL